MDQEASAVVDELRDVIRKLHGVDARYMEAVPVHEEFEGQMVWEGIIHVFDLDNHQTATRCYAWSERVARFGRFRQRFFAVLHQEPVDSPIAAVRATIVADYEAHGGERG